MSKISKDLNRGYETLKSEQITINENKEIWKKNKKQIEIPEMQNILNDIKCQ